MTRENRCLCCNKILYGITPCNCEKSKSNEKLWDKAERRKDKKATKK